MQPDQVEQAVEVTQGSHSVRFARSGTYSVLREMGIHQDELILSLFKMPCRPTMSGQTSRDNEPRVPSPDRSTSHGVAPSRTTARCSG